jgi:hypothetical protein
MDGWSCAAEPGEPTAAELAATEVELPDYEQREVRAYWERLIERCYAEVADAPHPTPWLVMSKEDQRRIRREARRSAAAVVRALPIRQADLEGGSEAA